MKKTDRNVFDKNFYLYLLVKVSVCIILPILLYVGTSVYVGFKVYNAVEASFRSKGSDYEKYTEFIGRINYQKLDYSQGNDENWRVNHHSFPLVLHNFKTAKAEYKYSIEGNSIGGKDIHVTVYMELRNGKWYVTGVSEPY